LTDQIIQGDWIKVMKSLPDKSVHCCVTSPPYWGQRNYGVDGQLGLEKTPEEHIENLVAGFRQVRRILRDDGVLWLNYGDKYNSSSQHNTHEGLRPADRYTEKHDEEWPGHRKLLANLQPGNLIGLAWRLALALQADGWILRSDIIWAKAVSFCETYCGSCMPESVSGWYWQQHKVAKCPECGALSSFKKRVCKECGWTKPKTRTAAGEIEGFREHSGYKIKEEVEWVDCPGCPKCTPNGGLVLRKGSWRPTRAHEYLFLLTKTNNYFSDMDAVREAHAGPERSGKHESNNPHSGRLDDENKQQAAFVVAERNYNPSGRNLRGVWTIGTQAFPEAHYATFPEKLIEPIVKVSTSEKGCCPDCGAQWARVVEKEQVKRERPADKTDRHNQGEGVNSCGNTVAGANSTTIGWRPTCNCGKEPVPCTVFDPFMGAGTVGLVTYKLNRYYLGAELSEEYMQIIKNRIGEEKDKYALLEQ